MKKVILASLIVLAFGISVSAAEYGNAVLVKCPHCGNEKAVINLLSGNTFGGLMWWDLCTNFPNNPEVCPIQKCPYCGKYFVYRTAEKRESTNKAIGKGTAGELTFNEARKAWEQLKDSISPQDLNDLALLCLHRYNDFHCEWPDGYKHKKNHPRSEDDHQFAKSVVDMLIANYKVKTPLIYAEWLCNVGEFDKAKKIVDETPRPESNPSGYDFARLYDILIECCAKKDSGVRLIY